MILTAAVCHQINSAIWISQELYHKTKNNPLLNAHPSRLMTSVLNFHRSITSFTNFNLARRFVSTRQMKIIAGGPRCLSNDTTQDPEFPIVSEDVKFTRYLTLYNRSVQFPDGQVHDFDVIGHPRANFHFCVTFPFHPAPSGKWQDGEVTLVREFCQGISGLAYCLPTGAFDPKKHSTYEDCAKAELSEEALLKGGSLLKLLEEGVGVPEVKWCRNTFTPFIAIDPVVDDQPGKRDLEEYIQVVRVSIPELKKIMKGGEMMLPSVTTCYWAMDYLAEAEK
jgi:hypothetical protein